MVYSVKDLRRKRKRNKYDTKETPGSRDGLLHLFGVSTVLPSKSTPSVLFVLLFLLHLFSLCLFLCLLFLLGPRDLFQSRNCYKSCAQRNYYDVRNNSDQI
jgi:hypothetical protein